MTSGSSGFDFLLQDTAALYHSRLAALFRSRWIIRAMRSIFLAAWREPMDRICTTYPDAEVIEDCCTPRDRMTLAESDPLELHRQGKSPETAVVIVRRCSCCPINRRYTAQ